MNPEQLALVAEIVSAYVGNNSVPRAELANLIADVHRALTALNSAQAEPAPQPTPAVNPKKSVFPDYIVSLENGKHFRSLKRHLTTLGMTPAQYREKWGLARDYPMVAESYAAKRSELAKRLGLGRKAAPAEREAPPPAPTAEPASASTAPAKPRKPRATKAASEA